jgi:phospholipase/lecithinase/hemolysin
LYQAGGRSFLFLTVPPTNRAPLIIEGGSYSVTTITSALADFNSVLNASVVAFKKKHTDLDQVIVFDTQPVFNTLLDNANALGFVNSTGYCDAYQNGTPEMTTQDAGCAPVSSYLFVFLARLRAAQLTI